VKPRELIAAMLKKNCVCAFGDKDGPPCAHCFADADAAIAVFAQHLREIAKEAEADDEVSRNYLRFQYDPNVSEEQKEKVTKFLSVHDKDRSRMHLAVLELEKAAFTQGYAFATGLFGPCYLCEECNVKNGVCIHPTMARFAEHAVGVNVKKTTEKAGIPIRFPFQKKPDRIALLLID
jgi:predicted metal-binding protein